MSFKNWFQRLFRSKPTGSGIERIYVYNNLPEGCGLVPSVYAYRDDAAKMTHLAMLHKQFARYEALPQEEKDRLATDEARTAWFSEGKKKAEEIYAAYCAGNLDESGYLSIINPSGVTLCYDFPPRDPSRTTYLWDCRFGCGTSPCTCEEDYTQYQALKAYFSEQNIIIPFINQESV